MGWKEWVKRKLSVFGLAGGSETLEDTQEELDVKLEGVRNDLKKDDPEEEKDKEEE